MKEIKLSKKGKNRGKYVALVDNEDYNFFNRWNWYAWSSRGIFYAARTIKVNGKTKTIHLHREIMRTPENLKIDHRDGNGLNCQRHNMRNCTHSQNMSNRKPCGTSKYLGVYIYRSKYIQVKITINGRSTYLGSSKNEEDAARIYDKAALKYHGEFANLNFKC